MDSVELKEDMFITNPLGMHVRPAARLVETVLPFESEVYIYIDGRRVNAKSTIGLMSLAAVQGTRFTVSCKGPDAQAAMDAVRDIVGRGFDDDEDLVP